MNLDIVWDLGFLVYSGGSELLQSYRVIIDLDVSLKSHVSVLTRVRNLFMIGQPNPGKPVLARRKSRFTGELKIFDRYKIAKISQYNFFATKCRRSASGGHKKKS